MGRTLTSRTNYSKRTLLGEWRAAEPSSSPRGEVRRGLQLLMHHRTSDGRYLVTRKVHWIAIFRILVDRGIYPDGTDYRGFCFYMESVLPTAECRVPLSYQSLKGISRTMYVRPFTEWRFDAVYGISRSSYNRMHRIAATLDRLLPSHSCSRESP